MALAGRARAPHHRALSLPWAATGLRLARLAAGWQAAAFAIRKSVWVLVSTVRHRQIAVARLAFVGVDRRGP